MQSESKKDAEERVLLLDFMEWLKKNDLVICKQRFGQWLPEGHDITDLPVRFSLDRYKAKAPLAAP